MSKIFKVAKIIDAFTLVINAGSNQGIKENQRFLIYSLDGEPVYDPDTKELLGKLEITKGTGTVISLQEKMCTIKSDMSKIVSQADIMLSPTISIFSDNIKAGDVIDQKFTDPQIGNLVKPV